jgi:Arc/MetJ-type ribon-helix-helix transcriptional regulator
MTIHLPKDVESSIEAAVQSGRFASAGDAVAAVWREFEQSDLGKGPSKQRKGAAPRATRPLTRAEFDQQLLKLGLMSQLPDTSDDFDDPDDEPIAIEGEPLSETVIRERR